MKNFVYFLEFIIVYILFFIFKLLGYKISSNLGFVIGKNFGQIFRSKRLIIENLKKSNIKINVNENKFATNVLGNYGRIFAEYPFIKDFRNGNLERFIQIEGKDYLDSIKEQNKTAVFVSGHFNNFELMAMNIEKAGVELAALYRPLNNLFLNKIMEKIRAKYICRNQIKKGKAGTRQIIECIKRGSSIALMIDQRVREGSKVNFFNKPATTTTIPAQLIKKYKCLLVPIYIERRSKYHFKMYVSKPIKINSAKSSDQITGYLNNVLERMIEKNPDQWIWTHDRWKN